MSNSIDKYGNIIIDVGTSVLFPIQVLQDSAQDPQDLTSASIVAKVKRNYTDVTPVISFSSSIVIPTSGTFQLSLKPQDTIAAGLSGSYVWDCLVTDKLNSTEKVLSGSLVANQTVSI